ncbi:DUF3225 domain-containing protein, partial [Salmonella enterica subsp. enterica serovar Montevideo]|nr:DUF3225 domain-containing protein [Salmonella enterica subsp. enterica serovar Montevideo]
IWKKAAFNSVMNTYCALLDCNVGGFGQRPGALDLAQAVVDEFGNAAVAEFDWHFTAVRRDNGQTQHTTGRESQVWAKIPNTGWRIVHVHYSGPAKTGVGEGY